MEKLNLLISKCKNSVSITVNDHRDIFESIEDYFKRPYLDCLNTVDDIEPEVYKVMLETDTIVDLQFYPNNSNGFIQIYHYSVELAIEEALLTFNK